jgi:hydroxylaminobenzene mutase
MGLAAHLEAVMNGMFLVLIGLIWKHLRLAARTAGVLFWLILYAGYANWACTLLGAIFGTSKMTPIAGAGHSAAGWQEAIVGVGLVSLSIAAMTSCIMVLWGLRGGGHSSAA